MNANVLIELAEILAAHQGVTRWAVSRRIFGRGDVFSRLMDGRDCVHSTIESAARWCGENRPEDLAWPEEIMRPDRHVDQERVA